MEDTGNNYSGLVTGSVDTVLPIRVKISRSTVAAFEDWQTAAAYVSTSLTYDDQMRAAIVREESAI